MAAKQSSIFGSYTSVGVTLNYRPHEGQQEVLDVVRKNFRGPNPAAIVEIICSRGWGKTLFMACAVLVPHLTMKPGSKVMWVAPSYSHAMAPVEEVFRAFDETTGERWVPEFDKNGNRVWEFANTNTGPVLRWFNGSTVTFKSADSPESIVSRGYDLIIIDEAALVEERVFTQQIIGTARRAGIKIWIISSPRGKRHWTHQYFKLGQDKNETDYLSFQQPWFKNPHFNPVQAKLIKSLPDWIFRQEYMAEFLDDGEGVFRKLDQVLKGDLLVFEDTQQEWKTTIGDIEVADPFGPRKILAKDRRFIVAMDLAKSIDFTVITVMDIDTGEVVYYKRFNKTDYRDVLDIVSSVCKTYNNAELIFDGTGVGSGISDFLNEYDITANSFVFSNESKNDIVVKLALAIEHSQISIPNIETIRDELATFSYHLTRTGRLSYSAPAGKHDDVVMSLALANFYRTENSVDMGNLAALEDIIALNNRGSKPRSLRQQMEEDND